MSNVEDARKAIQDFIAPDLKALAARLEALEKEMKMRFDHVDERLDHAEKVSLERSVSAEKLAGARHDTYMANHANLMNALDMEKRLARLENERAKPEAHHA